MLIGTVKIKLYAPWARSLKDKRMVVKSLLDRVRNKFNVSAAEVEEQDTLCTIVVGIACVADSTAFADSVIDHVLDFVESESEAEVLKVTREIR